MPTNPSLDMPIEVSPAMPAAVPLVVRTATMLVVTIPSTNEPGGPTRRARGHALSRWPCPRTRPQPFPDAQLVPSCAHRGINGRANRRRRLLVGSTAVSLVVCTTASLPVVMIAPFVNILFPLLQLGIVLQTNGIYFRISKPTAQQCACFSKQTTGNCGFQKFCQDECFV